MHNMVLGDLNCHFLIQTHFTSIIENFFNDLDFIIYWENQVQAEDNLIRTVDFTYHQVQNGESFVSTIDHFVSNNLYIKRYVSQSVSQ